MLCFYILEPASISNVSNSTLISLKRKVDRTTSDKEFMENDE